VEEVSFLERLEAGGGLMRMASDKMLKYAGDIEEYFVWAHIPYQQWKDDSFSEVSNWLKEYVPVYKESYLENGKEYREYCRLRDMDSWHLQYD